MSGHPPLTPSGAGRNGSEADMDPWLRAARRRELPVLIAVVAFGAFLVVVGHTTLSVVVLGLWVIGVGALLLAGRAVRDRQERGDGPRGAIALGTLDGTRATVLREHPARGLLTAGLTAWPGALLLAGAVIGAGSAMSAGLALAVGAVGVGSLVAGARRALHERRAGVWLTSAAVTVRDHRQSHRMAWGDVAAVTEPGGPTGLVLLLAREPAAVIVSGRARRGLPGGRGREVLVRAEATALDAPGIARTLRHLSADADVSLLGSAAGCEMVLRIARG